MTRWIAIAGALMLASALGVACASEAEPRWVKEGSTPAELKKDRDECMAQATIQGDVAADATTRSRVVHDFQQCMYDRGWKRVLP
jgi:hypothetical protein